MLRRYRRAFSLAELAVATIVSILIATFAFLAYRAVIHQTDYEKVKEQTRTWVRSAQALYAIEHSRESDYTWEEALTDAAEEFPPYTQFNALSEGQHAYDQDINGWRIQTDVSDNDSIYSTGPHHIVIKTSENVMFFSVAAETGVDFAPTGALFGVVAAEGTPSMWAAKCASDACDANSAEVGPPPNGDYGGTTVPTTAPPSTSPTSSPSTTAATTTTTVAPVTTTVEPAAVMVNA